jgi:hypothetical protein
MLRLHNRLLPTWLHRLANGFLVWSCLLTALAVAAPYGGKGVVSWLLTALLYVSPLLACLAAYFTPRWSLAEGLAGADGYHELRPTGLDSSQDPD